jgi:shikimate kinase
MSKGPSYMRLSLIGMAGSGKSHWSRKLEAEGFIRFCCDDLIAEKLGPELKNPDGTSMSVADWMGFPYENRYREREERYLSLEAEVVQEIIDYLESGTGGPQENIVVDTTGSVVYLRDSLLERLSRLTTIVLLATPLAVKDRLLNAYMEHPHPMLWRGMFERKPGESRLEALSRCYSRLFTSRERLYRRHAAVTIGYHVRRKENFGIADFLELIAYPY